MLIRATAAEASPNSQERAAVAAVILNRVRSGRYPNSIEAVLTQRNQFQAVTGTRFDPGPHSNFSNMSNSTGAEVIGAIIRYLPNMDKDWLNFTANNPAAYGRGTNINFMYAMRDAPGPGQCNVSVLRLPCLSACTASRPAAESARTRAKRGLVRQGRTHCMFGSLLPPRCDLQQHFFSGHIIK